MEKKKEEKEEEGSSSSRLVLHTYKTNQNNPSVHL
jgi:hypothetical protein